MQQSSCARKSVTDFNCRIALTARPLLTFLYYGNNMSMNYILNNMNFVTYYYHSLPLYTITKISNYVHKLVSYLNKECSDLFCFYLQRGLGQTKRKICRGKQSDNLKLTSVQQRKCCCCFINAVLEKLLPHHWKI